MANSTTVRFQLLPGALLLGTFLLCAQAVIAQSQSQYDKGTPPQFAAGVSSLGSYASADLGTVNLSNGALNLSLPIGTVGGRGLSLPLTLNWSSKIWSASIDYDRERGPGPGGLDDPNASMVPLAYADYANSDRLVSYYSRIEAGWTIGGVPTLTQTVVRINYTNTQSQGPCYGYTLPKLTLMMPDRGEVEFRDDVYDGAPLPSDCSGWIAASRGQRWHAVDGSGLIYINATNNGAAGQIPDLSGVVITGEGTRFFFGTSGVCYLIVDRHGNKITISGNEFVDPLGRTTTIQQDVPDPENPTETLTVLVTFKGYDNQPRYYKVRSGIMNQHYRSDINPNLPVITGSYDPMSWGYDSWYPASATKLFSFSYGLFVQQIDILPVISELILPDHRSLHFKYNQFGEVAEVQMPTGGKVWYDYGYDGGLPSGKSPIFETSAQYHTSVPFVDRALLKRRTFPDGTTLEGTWNYSYLGSSTTVTASAPDETVMLNEAHFFLPAGRYTESFAPGHHGTFYNLWSTGIEYRTETHNASGAILVASEQDWTQRAPVSWSTGYAQEQPAKDNRVNDARKILDDGSMTKVHTNYQPNVNYNNAVEVQEFDFDQSLKRRTTTTYADSSNPINGADYTSDSIHLLHLPLVTTVYDGNGNQKAQTVNEYDNYANDLNHAPLQDYGAVTQHDINYGASYTTRGNLTRAGRWVNLTSSFIYSYPRYDDLGNVVAAKDANGNVSTVSFIDDFGNGSNPGAGASGSFGATYALPTLITSPPPTAGAPVQTARSQYDFSTGLLTGFKDRNGVVTQTIYSDPFNRPTLVKAALGVNGVETHSATYYAPATVFGVTLTNNDVLTATDQTIVDDKTLRSWVRTDGFGRTIELWSRDPQGNDEVVTQYDALGRAHKQSNPFRPSLGETAVYTTSTYDLAGRVELVTTPDGASVNTSYNGNTVTVTDQAGKQRKSVTDGLGHLVKVYEAPNDPGFNYLTSYEYDALDNLTKVTQGTQTPRSFIYDSLKRLTSATNPESGMVTYSYDNNGNLLSKTDARSITVNYVYDALNRVTSRSYQNDPASTPAVTYNYDSSTIANGTGRLASASSNVSTYSYSGYDALGRIKGGSQTLGSITYPMSYEYDLAGHVTMISYPYPVPYPSGRSVSYTYDEAGRTSSFSGNLGNGIQRTYSTGIIYSPFGGMTKEQFGTDIPVYNKLFYNSRGQLSEIRASTSYTGPMDKTSNRGALVNWYSGQCGGAGCNNSDNNGNLKKQEVSIPINDQDLNPIVLWNQQYDYDALNRLKWVHESTGNLNYDLGQEYIYDRYGNRTINTNPALTYGGVNNLAFQIEFDSPNNRIYALGDLGFDDPNQRQMQYDQAGNLKKDTYTGSGDRIYDAENRMIKIKAWGGNNQWQEYSYNGDGQRVHRKVDGVETWQVYGMQGELLAEYGVNAGVATLKKEYGYRNGQLLVTAEAGTSDVPRTNYALTSNGSTATASTTFYNGTSFAPSATGAIDGEHRGSNYSTTGAWHSSTNGQQEWWEVDFHTSRTIEEINVFSCQDNWSNPAEPTESMIVVSLGLTQFKVRYLTESGWVDVPGGNVSGNRNVWRRFTFAPITTSKLRIEIQASGDNWKRIIEVEAWNKPGPTRTDYALESNGSTATASTTFYNGTSFAPSATGAIDGEHRGSNYSTTGAWHSSTNGQQEWWEVDFHATRTIAEIGVFSCQDNWSNPAEPTETMTFNSLGLTQFKVRYLTGSGWVDIANVSGNTKIWRKFSLATPITTNKLRIEIQASGDNWKRLIEVEAWSPLSAPGGGGTSANINWLVTDQLGTPRMIFDQTGTLGSVKRHDYLPFGEELVAGQGLRTSGVNGLGYSADTIRQKFTAKERDNETGLDFFGRRYYGSIQGRFTTTDPVPVTKESFLNPQRWNLYVYVNNNPLTAVDPNGGDGQGKGGDKVISVFLDVSIKDLGRRVTTDQRGKVTSDVPNTSDWQRTKAGAPSGYKVELYGSNEVTGNKGLPQPLSDQAFNNALKSSDVVLYVGHGRGDMYTAPFRQSGIKVGGTYYTATGTSSTMLGPDASPGPATGPKPDVTASVVGNFSCDAARNGGAYFSFVGQNQVMVVSDSSGEGGDVGLTSADALDKAANVFARTYMATGGNVQKAVDAANRELSKIPGNQHQNVGDEIKKSKVN